MLVHPTMLLHPQPPPPSNLNCCYPPLQFCIPIFSSRIRRGLLSLNSCIPQLETLPDWTCESTIAVKMDNVWFSKIRGGRPCTKEGGSTEEPQHSRDLLATRRTETGRNRKLIGRRREHQTKQSFLLISIRCPYECVRYRWWLGQCDGYSERQVKRGRHGY